MNNIASWMTYELLKVYDIYIYMDEIDSACESLKDSGFRVHLPLPL